jgi:hypothetical protein
VLLGATAGFVGLVLLLYFTSAHLQAATSDSATVVLEGQSIANGQVLLHGWGLTFASYWTSTAAFDAVAIALGGLRAGLMYAIPAFVGALAIASGVLVARDGRPGRPGVAGGAAVVVLLAFAAPAMAFFFVGRGFHVATGAYALLAFLALRRQGFSWGWLVAVLLLAAGLLGDLLMLAYGVVPLVVAGLVSALGERRWRAGLTPLTAAAGGVAVFGFARLVALALGTYSESSGLRIANFHQIVTNMGHLPLYLVSLLGLSDEVMASGGVPAPFSQIRGLGIVTAAAALFVLACFVLAFVKLVATTAAGRATADDRAGEQETRRLDDLLVVAVICSPAPFVLLAGARGAGVRYLTVTVVFAVVLAGRVVARALSGLRRGWPVALATGAGAALALALGASYGLAMSGPRYIDPATTLATWLEAHDLHKGLGGYWDASITTVQSGGAVVVRPVRQLGDGPVEKAALSRSDWYKGNEFQFVVYGAPSGYAGLRGPSTPWGRPEHVFVVGPYRVLVWGHDVGLARSGTAGR